MPTTGTPTAWRNSTIDIRDETPQTRGHAERPVRSVTDPLIAQEYQGLRALLARKLGDPALADDLLNQAIADALRKADAGGIREPWRFAGFVYQSALNLLRNHRRSFHNRRDRRDDAAPIEALPCAAAEDTLPANLQRLVRDIIEDLSKPRDRQIVKRYYLDEEDKQTICTDLGLAPLHFDKVIFRARRRLRELLEAKGFRRSDFFSIAVVCA